MKKTLFKYISLIYIIHQSDILINSFSEIIGYFSFDLTSVNLSIQAAGISRRRSANADTDIDNAVDALKHVPAWRNTLKDEGNYFIVGFGLVSKEDINHKTDDYAEKINKWEDKWKKCVDQLVTDLKL